MKFKYLPLFVSLILFSSCNKIKQQYTDGSESGVIQKDILTIQDSIIVTDSIIIPNKYEKELVFDFNGDNNLDSLYLGADVSLDENGNPLWDDAQTWYLNLKQMDSLHLLFSKDIQLGKLTVYFDDIKNDIYLIEKGPYQSDMYKLNTKTNFKPVAINKLPDTSEMIILSLD